MSQELDTLKEGRWRESRRNKDCGKDPNYWHSYRKGSTEIEVSELLGALVRALQPELVVETGTSLGHTSIVIGEALQKNGHGRLVTIEAEAKRHRYAAKKCMGLPIECIHGESLNWSPPITELIDFLYIDSSFESRLKEFDHFSRWFTKYTIVAWHDTGTQHEDNFDIRNHITRLETTNRLTPIYLPTPRGICIGRVVI